MAAHQRLASLRVSAAAFYATSLPIRKYSRAVVIIEKSSCTTMARRALCTCSAALYSPTNTCSCQSAHARRCTHRRAVLHALLAAPAMYDTQSGYLRHSPCNASSGGVAGRARHAAEAARRRLCRRDNRHRRNEIPPGARRAGIIGVARIQANIGSHASPSSSTHTKRDALARSVHCSV